MKSEMPPYNPSIGPSLNLINALIHLKEQGPWEPSKGICVNIQQFAGQSKGDNLRLVLRALDTAFSFWPKAHHFPNGARATMYPVGGPQQYHEEVSNGTIWKNRRRIELLEFTIDYLNIEG